MPPKAGAGAGNNSFNAQDYCFFNPPGTSHSWLVGKVVEIKDGDAKVRKRVTVKADDEARGCVGETFEKLDIDNELAPCREDLLDETVNDLLSLTILHDATLLRCLNIRYMRDVVYSNIGSIVVALNPFNYKIPWYMDDNMPRYLAHAGNIITGDMYSDKPGQGVVPHSWAQAHNTYTELIADQYNQCILISGESGAGKTEATKIVMKYLAHVSSLRGDEKERAAGMAVGTKLHMCSPILESFGNARTVRNDNSSRFGKFMKVKFNGGGFLIGAHTTKYLLEKSRIVTSAKGERVYHAFYIAVRGSYAKELLMEPDASYKSLTIGQCMQNSEFNSPEDFKTVKDAMTAIGMEEKEIRSVWACTCGVLSSLNINFLPDGEGSKVDPATMKYLERAVALWGINKDALEKEYCKTVLEIAGEKTTKVLRPELAIDIRDATAKAIYNSLFGMLVEKCNEKCDVEATGNWIGLLDIFGFEDFEFNSFEQLCINLANETLQNHYNTYIFRKDMEECKLEGIDVTEIKCPDNMPCLDMIRAKGGILSLLDEECTLGKATDLTFLAKVEAAFGKHAFFDKKKSSQDTFIILHYAASVTYNVKNWLEKNRDTLKDDIKRCMRASEDPVAKELLDEPLPPDQKKGKVTVGGFFKDQVGQLMDVINSTNPHWIRCVKPHPAKKARMFDGVQTMNQLESSGVLGTVKIRKAGYPIRVLFSKFTVRYKICALAAAAKKEGKDLCVEILKAAQMDGKQHAQMGKTKVFMKAEAFPLIERRRNEALARYVLQLQRFGRGYLGRLKANKDWRATTQHRAAKLFVDEFRAYMKRSAAIREERARIRREIEEKFRGRKLELEREFNNFFDMQVSQYETDLGNMKVKMEKELEAERKRQEHFRASREAFMRTEYVARMHLFDESLSDALAMQDLYSQELQLFRELELACVEESAKALRVQIMTDEREARNTLWRGLQEMQATSELDGYLVLALQSLGLVRAAEDVSWAELNARTRLLKQELKIRMTFGDEEHMHVAQAKQREKAHKMFDKQKDHELMHLRSLYNSELSRVDEQRRAALHALEQSSAAQLGAMGSGVPAGSATAANAGSRHVAISPSGTPKPGSAAATIGTITATASNSTNAATAAATARPATAASNLLGFDLSPPRGSALGSSGASPSSAGDGSPHQQQQHQHPLENYSPSLLRAITDSYGASRSNTNAANDASGAQAAARAIEALKHAQQGRLLMTNEHAHWYEIDSKLSTSTDRALQSAIASKTGGAAARSGSGTAAAAAAARTHSAGASVRSGSHLGAAAAATAASLTKNPLLSQPVVGADHSSPFRFAAATSPLGVGGGAMHHSTGNRSNSNGGGGHSASRGPLAHYAGSTQLSASAAENFLFGAPPPRAAAPPIIQRAHGAPPPPLQQPAAPMGRLTAATADQSVFGSPVNRARRF